MAATWKAGGGEITLNGATPVTLAGPPLSGKTMVLIGLSGVFDGSYSLTIRVNKGGVFTNIETSLPVSSGARWPKIEPVGLDAIDETVEALLNTAGTPKVVVATLVEQ